MMNGKNQEENDPVMVKVVMLVSFLSTISFTIIVLMTIYLQVKGTIDILKAIEVVLVINLGQLLVSAIRNSVLNDRKMALYLIRKSKVVVSKGAFFNKNVKASADLYTKGITPTNALPKSECVFIVAVEIGEFSEAPLLTVRRTSHSKTITEILNKGRVLSDKGAYLFSIVARSGELINFQFNSEGMIKQFAVEELYIP